MNTYTLSTIEEAITYEFMTTISYVKIYQDKFNIHPSYSYYYTSNTILNAIIPHCSFQYDKQSLQDTIIFNNNKDLTIFLLKKDTFFNYLQNNDYTALGL